MTYDYNVFWSERGKIAADKFNETKQEKIKGILLDCPYVTVLEFGCGDGQLSKIIKQLDCHLTGVDISEDRLKINNYIDSKILHDISKDFFYPVSDLVICSHFLLHIKPNEIKTVIQNMIKYASKYVIFIEPNPILDLGKWEDYNFQHNYDEILTELNFKFEIIIIDKFVNCWIVKK